ncbi:alpha/beta-hydrolase [Microthyrium microscopicum]|uniref:Alpha/beta-hydrolase n=1 Tax=Microthyrium microscopicum TaxID=703497 RepID=A0A6A6U0C5_9PEZI|nr:alpha/beta-hydrolase [Microthyrium microscopicum]
MYPSTSFIGLFGLFAVGSANPVNNLGPRNTLAIDPNLFNTISRYEQFAAAAYCDANIGGFTAVGSPLRCSRTNNCPDVESSRTQIVAVLPPTSIINPDGTRGYIAVDSSNSTIVVAFRGTLSIENQLANLQIAHVPVGPDLCLPPKTDCTAHRGFLTSWESVSTLVLDAVSRYSSLHPTFRIGVTGHSFGGAVATHAAVALRNRGLTVDLVTFGSPRVGNGAYVDYIQSQNRGQNMRVVHADDNVPNSPDSQDSFNGFYRHLSPSYFISTATSVTPTANDVTMRATPADFIETLTAGVGDGYYNRAHNFYINGIADCANTSNFAIAMIPENTKKLGIASADLARQFPDTKIGRDIAAQQAAQLGFQFVRNIAPLLPPGTVPQEILNGVIPVNLLMT